MRQTSALKFFLPLFVLVFAFTSCDMDENPVKSFGEAVERVPDVQVISGAENATVHVKYDRQYSYFNVTISNIGKNNLIKAGTYEAWCLQMDLPIGTGQDYTGRNLYATNKDKLFNKITYIVNNRDFLEKANQGLSWKDIQVAMWVILETRDMNLDSIRERLPSAVEGYNAEYVNNIINDVQTNGSDFSPGLSHRIGIMADNEDEQGVIIFPEDNTAWARMNNDATDFTYAFNPDGTDSSTVGGGNWATYLIYQDASDLDETAFMYAGKENFAGYADITRVDDSTLEIKFTIEGGYELSEYHIHVGSSFSDFPTSSNLWENPKIGHFEYNDDFDPFVTSATVTIDWDLSAGSDVYIAIHGVVWN